MRLLALFRILYSSQLLFTNNLFKSNWSTHTAARSYAHTRTHTLKTPSDAPEKTTKRTTTKRAAKQQKSNVSKFSFALHREIKSNRNLKDCQCDFDLMFIVFFFYFEASATLFFRLYDPQLAFDVRSSALKKFVTKNCLYGAVWPAA